MRTAASAATVAAVVFAGASLASAASTSVATAPGSHVLAGAHSRAAELAPVGLYDGAINAAGVEAVDAAAGGQVQYAMDYIDDSSWAKLSDPSWFTSGWSGSGFKMIWSVAMMTNGSPPVTVSVMPGSILSEVT